MKQKIVIKMQLTCEKSRAKALKIAAKTCGAISVAIEGSNKDEVVVIGENVDSVNLTRSLRKKFCYVAILKVDEVKPPKPSEPPKPSKPPSPGCPKLPMCPQYPPFPMYYEPMYYQPYLSDPGCLIM